MDALHQIRRYVRQTVLTLDQLVVFNQVVASGSFSKAARALRRAQSAVSYAIANLEAQLEVELFDRSGHKPVLTAAGEALLADAQSIGSRVDGMLARARWLASGQEARVRLAVDVMFPMHALVSELAEFEERFPTVALEVYTEALGGVAQLVIDGRCDVGVGSSFGELPPDLEFALAVAVPSAGVVSPEHPLAKLPKGFANQLLDDHVQIVLTDRSSITEGQQRGVFSSRIWRVADLHTKRALLVAGFGFGTMPLHLVKEDLAANRLVRLRAHAFQRAVQLRLRAMWRRASPPGPIARWLLDRLAHGQASGSTT
jgi:DNA-binding transcriptional LysR family regulator